MRVKKNRIKGIGNIDITPVAEPNITELETKKIAEKKRLTELFESHEKNCDKIKAEGKRKNDKHLTDIQEFNKQQIAFIRRDKDLANLANKITESVFYFMQFTGLDLIGYDDINAKLDKFLKAQEKPQKEKPITNLPDPTLPDFTVNKTKYYEIQERINSAKADQILYNAYTKRVEKQGEKETKINSLAICEEKLRTLRKAKKENKTILATIVGEKPATVPTEIGVFVVEDGELI